MSLSWNESRPLQPDVFEDFAMFGITTFDAISYDFVKEP